MNRMLLGLMVTALSAGMVFAAGVKSVEDVMDYGAVGDGRTDDTAAILKAEAAAWKSGKPLFFPTNDVGSTYLTRKGVILVSGMILTADRGAVLANASAVLQGGGKTLRIRLAQKAKKGDCVLHLTHTDGLVPGQEVTIYNDHPASWGYSETLADIATVNPADNTVTIDTSRYTNDDRNVGMFSDMPAGTGSVLTDFALVKTVQRKGRDAENVIVENITVRPYGNPNDPYIYTISPIAETAQNRPAKQSNFIVRNVTVDGSMHDGISTQGSGDIWIENCTVRNVKHKGIHWGTSCDRVIIRGNLCEDCGSVEYEKVSNNGGTGGMYFCYNNHRMIIVGNTMRRCFKGVFGFDAREVGGSDTDSIVADNIFDDCTLAGIKLESGLHINVTGNRFVNFTGNGVPILTVKEWGGLQYPVISDNVCEKFQDGWNAALNPIDLTHSVGAVARNNVVRREVKGRGEGEEGKGRGEGEEGKGGYKRSFVKKDAYAADFDISRDWYFEFVQRLDVTADVNAIASFAAISFRYLRGPIQALWSQGGATRYIYSANLPNADFRWPASESHHFLVTSTNRVIRGYLDGRLLFTTSYAGNYTNHPYANPPDKSRVASVQKRHDVRLFRVGYLAAGADPEKVAAEHFNGGNPLAWNGAEPERLFELREGEIAPEGIVKDDPYAPVVSGEGVPTRAPRYAGQRYRDTKASREYVAKGNALPCDWRPDFAEPVPKAKGPHARPDLVDNLEDVTAYGAVGDGVADDSAAIARAIAAAKTSGKSVHFPKTSNSVYFVTQPIALDGKVRVTAYPPATVRSATTALVIRGKGVQVENLGFASLANDAVVVDDAEDVRMRHIRVEGAAANGLVVRDGEDIVLEDSLIRQAKRFGVRLEGGCEDVKLVANLFADCGTEFKVKKGEAPKPGTGGCLEFAGSEDAVVTCNHFTDSPYGLFGYGKGDEDAKVSLNTFNHLTVAGALLGGGEGLRFYGNRFLRFGRKAVPFKAVSPAAGKPFRDAVIEANGIASFEGAMAGKRQNPEAYVNEEGAIVLEGAKNVMVVGNCLRRDTIVYSPKNPNTPSGSVEISVTDSSGCTVEGNVVE